MENYIYLEKEDYNKELTTHNKKRWGYYSKKKMKQLYPNNDYKVIKEVNPKRKSGDGSCIVAGDQKLKLRTLEKNNPFLYRTCGYIECHKEVEGEEIQSIEYVAVKKDQLLKSLLILLLVLLLLLGGALWYMNREQGPVFEESAIAYKMPDGVAKNTDPDRISVPGYGQLSMKKEAQEIYVALINPEGNPCYFRYRMVLRDTNETLYESDLIKPGMAVTNVKINQKLKEGTYDITLLIDTASLDDYKQELNGGAVETTLVVK